MGELDSHPDTTGLRSFGYGSGKVTTSAFLMLGQSNRPGAGIWPLALYPGTGRGGTAEVVFAYLADRAPFTDLTLRTELACRLSAMDGVDIPDDRLALRPTFRLSVLADDANSNILAETLTWFASRCREANPDW